MKNQHVSSGIGYFDQLPADVIYSSILSGLDFKNLCQCLLVSKSFASMIYHTPTLTVKLPCLDVDQVSSQTIRRIPIILREIMFCTSKKIPQIIRRSPMKSLIFYRRLKRFTNLKSIHVEFGSPELTCCYSPKRTKLICRSSGSMVVLLPASIRKISKNDSSSGYAEEPVNKENPIEFMEKESQRPCLRSHNATFAEWLSVLFLLIKTQDSLESVTIGNSYGECFVVRGEQLVECRKILFSPTEVATKYSNVLCRRKLQLPVSGYVMKAPLCMIMGLQEDNEVEYDDVRTGKYKEEKVMFDEAVTELKKYTSTERKIFPWDHDECTSTIVGRRRQTCDGWTIVGRVW